MRLELMGSRFQTRLSFMRQVLRRLHAGRWSIEQTLCEWDHDGFGTAVYRAQGPQRCYSLVAFTHHLDSAERSDRVIAEKWDATFVLFDGEPSRADIERLRNNVPKQEAGRFSSSELSLSRANKSVRLFEHVVECLAQGRQPDRHRVGDIGYLMRTTAVYGNGKFGCADLARLQDREEFSSPFQSELLTVYLIRCLTHDLVEHIAHCQNPQGAVMLDRDIRRYLGIGNSTGLGMAPFIYHHPLLTHQWVAAVETALSNVRGVGTISAVQQAQFAQLLSDAQALSDAWQVANPRQMQRIVQLRSDLTQLEVAVRQQNLLQHSSPWDAIYRWASEHLSTEARELLVSLLIEMHPERVDHLAASMSADESAHIDPSMSIAGLKALIEAHYHWALTIDFELPEETHYFWYVSEEKLEPRIGERHRDTGAEYEHLLTAARDVSRLYGDLISQVDDITLAEFLLHYPQHRHIVRRVQRLHDTCYAEIQDNLLNQTVMPIDMLRFKLSFFGATRFDPKSDKWMRIALYQGAPLPDELDVDDCDRWMFLPCLPSAAVA